jgi:peptidoglycan/LPS O-acetylase OafA/YrhL
VSSSLAATEGYRPDIDGLRALAVRSAIFFHIDKRLAPGGFVAVDAFFVISGYPSRATLPRISSKNVSRSSTSVFPGLRALPPTVGTALLILTGHRRDHLTSKLLSVKPLVGVGLASYSAYLWHWPLLAFYRYGYGDISAAAGCVLLIVITALGYLSYVWIEQPMRNSRERRSQRSCACT